MSANMKTIIGNIPNWSSFNKYSINLLVTTQWVLSVYLLPNFMVLENWGQTKFRPQLTTFMHILHEPN